MKSMPRSSARRSTAIAAPWLRGSPQIPAPGRRMAPKASRWVVETPRRRGALAGGGGGGVRGVLDSKRIPKPRATFAEVIPAYEQAHAAFVTHLRRTPDAELNKTVKFHTGPKQMSDLRRMDVLWFLLHDAIHHRGQMSIYLRMVDAKVPSIYGPTADEPWS